MSSGSRAAALRSEAGMTLVELLAAVLLLGIGVIGVVGSLDVTRSTVNDSEARETLAHIAQRELEEIVSLPYAQVALTSAPAPSADPAEPDNLVRTGPAYQWDRTDAARVEPLAVNGVNATGGTVPKVEHWTYGRLRGRAHAYVTWVDDRCPTCTGTTDYKRVTVSVVIDGPFKSTRPVTLTTLVVDRGGATP